MPSTTVTMRAVASTRTYSGKPTSALSAAGQAQLAMRPSTSHSFVQFGLPRDLPGSQVTSAKIQVRATEVWSGTRSLVAQLISKPASGYSKMTWNNAPALATGSVARTGTPWGSYWYEVDVTADIQAFASGAAYYGHRLLTTDTSVTRIFYGQAHATAYPRMVLTYATITPAPAQVAPSGAVGVSRPVFSWAAPGDVTKIEAQADVVGGTFAVPSWASGELLSNLGHIDTAALGWAGQANGVSTSFRFRQYGSLGWSAWSLPVTVTRADYAPLTVSLPPVGGVSNDPTPPHVWAFAGQSKFRLWITDATGRTLYDSREVSGTDQGWTPVLSSLAISPTATLTSHLRVWDDRTGRKASPGDPGYVETAWSWTLAQSTATAPATGFNVVMPVDRPVPRLSCTRTIGAPDEWIIERDGVLVAKFDGDVGQQSPTTWVWDEWTCPPNRRSVRYSVRALVAGKMSAPSDVVVIDSAAATGLAIYEPLSGAWFNVAGDAASGLEMGETALTYKGPYAQATVKRILSLGGISGPVSGFLTQQGDRPMLQQLADVATIRSYPTRVCRLVYGYVNVPVVVSGLSPILSGDAMPTQMMHRISFSVDQVDEFDTAPTGAGV